MQVEYPLILINFKTYLESQGKKSVALAKTAEKVAQECGVCIAVAPQAVDIAEVARSASVPVFSQHIDPEPPGSQTGHTTPESVKEAGACGSILNHSERRLRIDAIEASIKRCRSLGLISCVCANTSPVGKGLSALEPDMIAVEPPELIGSGISVSKAKPEIIADSVRMIRLISEKPHVLCGAGITTGDDVGAAVKLGAEGVLVASGVVKAGDPEAVLREFASKVHSHQP